MCTGITILTMDKVTHFEITQTAALWSQNPKQRRRDRACNQSWAARCPGLARLALRRDRVQDRLPGDGYGPSAPYAFLTVYDTVLAPDRVGISMSRSLHLRINAPAAARTHSRLFLSILERFSEIHRIAV